MKKAMLLDNKLDEIQIIQIHLGLIWSPSGAARLFQIHLGDGLSTRGRFQDDDLFGALRAWRLQFADCRRVFQSEKQ